MVVKELSLEELDARADVVEAVLDQTDEVDPWCSGPDWILPVHHGFASGDDTLLLAAGPGEGGGYGLLARYRLSDGRTMVAGLEPLWGFASPLLGAESEAIAASVAEHLDNDPDWDVLVLPGMPTPTGPDSFTTGVVRGLARLGAVRVGEGITTRTADLSRGHPAWLDRRGSRFRRNVRQAGERAEREGVSFHDVSAQPDVFDRLLLIESRSWKGIDDSGITSPEMSATYRAMVERLQGSGRARIHVARRREADVGYILGGVRAGRYRGLQLSYTEDAAELSIGHLLQHHQIQLLCKAEEATTYDLGMDLDYKQRWADDEITTYTIVIERNGDQPTSS